MKACNQCGKCCIHYSDGGLSATTGDDARRFQQIEIINDGPAIPDQDLERIFNPFVTNKSDGAGLGLSVASRIIEQHDGFMEVRNASEAQGVVFSVLLPQ